MDSLADFIDEERDVLFIRGQRIGQRKGQLIGERIGQRRGEEAKERDIVTNMLTSSDLTVEQIANFTKVSIDFVLNVKAELSKKSK